MKFRMYVELEIPAETLGPATPDWVRDSFLDLGARFGEGSKCDVILLRDVPPPGSQFEGLKSAPGALKRFFDWGPFRPLHVVLLVCLIVQSVFSVLNWFKP